MGTDGWQSGQQLTSSFANTADDMYVFLAYQLCESYGGARDLTSTDVPCTDAHTAEMLPTAVDLPGGADAPYPDEDTITAAVADTCVDALVDYVGQRRDDLGAVWWPPTSARWDLGDRRVTCGVEAFFGRVTGSLFQLGDGPLETIPFDEPSG
jgi:hypothetical protein